MKRQTPFGDIVEIRKVDFVREVTDASAKPEVAMLLKPGVD